MAGKRWFASGAVASMGWWCLIIFAIGECCGVLAADSAAMEPSAAGARGEEGGCYRPLSDVIWGFLVTLLALTTSLWGSRKHIANSTAGVYFTILAGVFAPLADLEIIIQNSVECVSLLWICHKMEHPNSCFRSCSWFKFLCSSLFPWSKSPARILTSCDIVVYLSKNSPLLQKKWLWTSGSYVTDESEAMVVGENGARAIRKDQYERKGLTEKGMALLVWKEVFSKTKESKRLPKYDELKYLRGNSGFAVIAIAVQAFGYVYAVGFRLAKNLRISPLEVIGLVFNIILLMKVFFYSTCNLCHRPLVIYMDKDWEHEVGEFSNNNQQKLKLYYSKKVEVVIFLGIVFGLNTLLIFCIVHIIKAINVMVGVLVILFLLGLWLVYFRLAIPEKYCIIREIIAIVGFLLTAVAYIWAIVGTMLYWKTMHFNMRGDLINLSQIIPFIG